MVSTARSDAEPGGPSPTGPCQGRRGAHSLTAAHAWRTPICHRAGSGTALGRPPRRRSFTVPQNKDLKRLVRTRMAETGENYTQALSHLQDPEALEPLPSAWHMTGSQAAEYEAGLLPGVTYDGDRIARLRLRPAVAEPSGFGALVQTIAAPRYVGCRVSFSAMVRASEVTDWAGLWMRVDGPGGMLVLDNMQDRALRGTTDWTRAAIVLDVAEHATIL